MIVERKGKSLFTREVEREYEVQKGALDKIDFLPYIEKYKGKKFWDLVSAVEDDYNNTELTNNDVLEGWIFNWFCEDEIIDYLEKRYPNEFSVREIIYNEIC